MKRILVTGSEGFIGKALVRRLKEEGYDVIGFDVPQGDISGENPLRDYLDKDIEYVFHLAGKTFVPDSWEKPFDFYKVNVLGTLNVLDFCRRSGSGMTFISSYTYGPPDYLPVDENHPIKAYNPYSHSKIMAEELCLLYLHEFRVQVCIIRPFNIYGPNQPKHFIIPEIIQKILDPNAISLNIKDTKPKRDFLYLDDFISALLLSINAPREIFNVGSGKSVSVKEIIEFVFEITGKKKKVRETGIQRPNEIYDLYADIKRYQKLGWAPSIDIQEGLERCINSEGAKL